MSIRPAESLPASTTAQGTRPCCSGQPSLITLTLAFLFLLPVSVIHSSSLIHATKHALAPCAQALRL